MTVVTVGVAEAGVARGVAGAAAAAAAGKAKAAVRTGGLINIEVAVPQKEKGEGEVELGRGVADTGGVTIQAETVTKAEVEAGTGGATVAQEE